ncbi:hypothetical protein BDV29DRAFT_59931 [Aspergillus leporis]|jgi:hypothetical protein|uniref:Uncharacterized protein n=1 Tax=Aspergillus leporis TaxID=41062 RepID=A0A5N5WKF9_9EURO|nr:hypothetical protein BDV29DRAFT_59931 [Aspergillus leporis]
MTTQAEGIAALLGGLLALNIHVLISALTLIPTAFDSLLLGHIYVLSLQLLVALFIVRLLCIMLSQPLQFQSANIRLLVLIYGVIPKYLISQPSP